MGYQIPFRSFKNTAYVLEINGGGTALDGAVDTFVTDEDANTDFFTPVRTQSGTFRYIGSGANDHAIWLSMVPTDALSIPVKLKAGSTVKWQGYIQPEVYHNDYPANGSVMEHEFNVQCPLSVLDTIDINTNVNSHPVVTIGQLLHTHIFSQLTGTTINRYYFQGNKDIVCSRLNTKVMWANFLDTVEEGNAEGVSTVKIVPKYTCRQVLEEVCKLFGWTCRMHGTYVYFTMPVDNSQGFSYFTADQMISTATSRGTNVARGSFSIADNMFCDNDNHEQVLPGIGKVTVRSDINPLDNLVEVPYDELFDQYNLGTNETIVRSVDYYEREVYATIKQPQANGASLVYENDEVSLTVYMANKPTDATDSGNGKKYGRFLVYDDGDVGDPIPESKQSFSWKKCIELFHSYEYTGSNSNDMFKITSKQMFVLSNGILYINFKCDEVSAWLDSLPESTHPNMRPKLTCRLKISDGLTTKYWNGSAWSTSAATFTMKFNASGAKSTRTSITDPQYNGYGVPVSDTLRGTIEFAVVDVPAWVYEPVSVLPLDINGFCSLMDFEIGFVRGVIEDTKHRGNEFTATGGNFSQEYNVDLIFASDVVYGPTSYQRHMPAGLGYILNASEQPEATVAGMGTQGEGVIPEKELARVIAKYGETTHRLVQVNLFTDLVGNVVPTAFSTGLEDGMFPLAIGHNWRDDVTTLTLIEL